MLKGLKPGASIRTHLFVAGSMWFAVGIMLLSLGFGWLPADSILTAVAALLFGTIKALFMLDRVALKNISRILRLEEGTCIGAVYSLQSWGMVLGMMVLGRLLRAVALPRQWIAALYIAVGWALVLSSRKAWLAWHGLEK